MVLRLLRLFALWKLALNACPGVFAIKGGHDFTVAGLFAASILFKTFHISDVKLNLDLILVPFLCSLWFKNCSRHMNWTKHNTLYFT